MMIMDRDGEEEVLAAKAEAIQRYVTPQQSVFIKREGQAFAPGIVYISYLAKRNIMYAADLEEVGKILARNRQPEAIFFAFLPSGEVSSIKYLRSEY
jgi:hypothetical protein